MALLSENIVTIATSLDKFNIAKQYQVIENWKSAGFAVISVNASADVDILGPHFPDVAFAIDKNARYEQDGTCYVHFSRLIHVLRASKGDICGIIRPDVHFIGNETAQTMLNGAKSGINFADNVMNHIQQFGVFFFCRKAAVCYLSNAAISFRC